MSEPIKYNKLIILVSILIPVVVAILFTVKLPNVEPLSFLPPIYASINALTALLLISALVAIKNKKIKILEFKITKQIVILCLKTSWYIWGEWNELYSAEIAWGGWIFTGEIAEIADWDYWDCSDCSDCWLRFMILLIEISDWDCSDC